MSDDQRKEFDKKQKHQCLLIEQGYTRVLEKVILELQQAFFKAVCAGTRGSSRKLVFEHYDTLKPVWGGAPSAKPLMCGIDSCQVNAAGDGIDCQQTDESSDSFQSPVGSKNSLDDCSIKSTDVSTPLSIILFYWEIPSQKQLLQS